MKNKKNRKIEQKHITRNEKKLKMPYSGRTWHYALLMSDCGTKYKNEPFSELCSLLDIKQTHFVPYRSQSVGIIERDYRVMNEYFRSYIKKTTAVRRVRKVLHILFQHDTTHVVRFSFFAIWIWCSGSNPWFFQIQNSASEQICSWASTEKQTWSQKKTIRQ